MVAMESVMKTYHLTVSYEGTHYFGWQIQPNRPTIQGHLQEAIKKVVNQPINVVGSGRTDSGVHAVGQVVSCRLPWTSAATQLAKALNTKLPSDITVRDSVEVVSGFHAIRDSLRKRYRYQIQIGEVPSPFERRFRWLLRNSLDLSAMQEAARTLEGRQDFASFQASGADRGSTVRSIFECTVKCQSKNDLAEGMMIAIEVEADGFLYNMVRNIVGSLVQIGSGKEQVQWIKTVLAARDRTKAGPTAPPHGLFLMSVDYPKEIYLIDG